MANQNHQSAQLGMEQRIWLYTSTEMQVFLDLHSIIAELSSGPKGRRAEPHNYRAKIEIEKTMRLSFHGHRG